jgi:hypothetical protein
VNIEKLHQPSNGMNDTLDRVSTMLTQAPGKVDGPRTGEKIDHYRQAVVALLNLFNFLESYGLQNWRNYTAKYGPPNKILSTERLVD